MSGVETSGKSVKESAQVGGYGSMSGVAESGKSVKESAQVGGYGSMSREAKNESKREALMEARIKNAVEQLRVSEGTAEEAAALWSVPVDRARGDEWYLEGTASYTGPPARPEDVRPGDDWENMREADDPEDRPGDGGMPDARRSRSGQAGQEGGFLQRILHSPLYRMGIAAAAAVVCIWVLSYYQYFMRADTTVFLDVNPSMTITANRAGQIIKAEGNNADAEAVLAGTDLRGKRTREALEEILRVLREQGYLTEQDAAVLLSIECKNASRLMTTSGTLTAAASDYMEKEFEGGAVFSQRVQMTDEIREFAKSHSVSAGKAALILQLVQDHPDLDPDQLAALSMSELAEFLHSADIDLRDYLEYSGENLDAKWQKEDEARKQESPQDAAASEGMSEDAKDTKEQPSGSEQVQQEKDSDDDSRDEDHDDDRADTDDRNDRDDPDDRADGDEDDRDDPDDRADGDVTGKNRARNDSDVRDAQDDEHDHDEPESDNDTDDAENDHDADDTDDDD